MEVEVTRAHNSFYIATPQVEHPVTKQVHRYWFENPRMAKPYHENTVGDEGRLFPRDCREGVSAVIVRAEVGSGSASHFQCAVLPQLLRHDFEPCCWSSIVLKGMPWCPFVLFNFSSVELNLVTVVDLACLLAAALLCPVQGATYKGALTLDLCWDVEGLPGTFQTLQKRLGFMPVMVKSSACHLHGE